ncbi:MAG TPA: hypothetical protein VGL20_12745 [Candidatus Dormibacteraeota bacterium]
MLPPARPRMLAPGVILIALVGVWLTHTLEYARVSGAARLSAVVLAPVHAYMLPVGALLTLGAALLGVRCWRAWWRLGRRLEQTRAALAGGWRGREPGWRPAAPVPRRPSEGAQLLALWLPLSLLQAGLYLLQENAEALAAGRPPPGLGAVTGVHAPVLAVLVLVAWALAWAVLLVLRRLGERRGVVAACERLLLALLRHLGRAAAAPQSARATVASPLDRFGRELWRRPPPLLLPD